MALVTTFVTSPLTIYFYPRWYQKKVEAFRRGEIDWDGNPLDGSDSIVDGAQFEKLEADKVKRLTVYLRLDSMPNLLAFASLFGGKAQKQVTKTHPSLKQQASHAQEDGESAEEVPRRPVEAHGLRLLNLTDRGSSVMQVYETESYTTHDPVVNIFRTFGRLHNLAISGEALVVPEDSFADTLSARAADSDLLLLPWSETGGMSEQAIIEDKGTKNKLAAPSYLSFIKATLEQTNITTAVLVNKNFGGPKNRDKKNKLTRTYSSVSLSSHRDAPVTAPITDKSHHVFFPFFGGDDDRAALRLVLQLAENPEVTATIVQFEVPDAFLEDSEASSDSSSPVSASTKGAQGAIVSTTAQRKDRDAAFFASLRASLPTELSHRVVFDSVHSDHPVKDVIARASLEVGQAPKNGGDLVVLGRNIGRKGLEKQGADEIRSERSAATTLGVLAERAWESKLGASVLVVKAGQRVV
jgi:hypothetical protein